jgi:site-specific recombinase XerD
MNNKEFTAYLESKGLAKITQEEYKSNLQMFFNRVKKEDIQITKPDILAYLEYLKKRKRLQNVTRRNHLIALNHYFTYLYQSGQIAQNPCLLLKIRGTNKKQLHKIYTSEELDTLFDNYYHLFVRNYDDSRHRHEAQRQYPEQNRNRRIYLFSIQASRGLESGKYEQSDFAAQSEYYL